MAKRQNGKTAKRQNGKTAEKGNGRDGRDNHAKVLDAYDELFEKYSMFCNGRWLGAQILQDSPKKQNTYYYYYYYYCCCCYYYYYYYF